MVKLPEGEDENEWLAVNMVDFYNQVNLLYGAITEFCSPQSCPEMKATDEYVLSIITYYIALNHGPSQVTKGGSIKQLTQ